MHANFTKEDSGHHDQEQRQVESYLPSTMQHKMKKLVMYTHHVFYKHRLEDLATKGIPGGGAESNGGRIDIASRKSAGGSSSSSGRLSKDDLMDVMKSCDDSKIGDALAQIAESQVLACVCASPSCCGSTRVPRQAQNTKRQKIEMFVAMKTNGQLTSEQTTHLDSAITAEIMNLVDL